jgi:putative phosphoribosyl transferase
LATLLFDLLLDSEAADRGNVFNIALLAERLAAATALLRHSLAAEHLPIAYFGASTGAAAALAAASADHTIAAVVSRGGRPDLAGDRLAQVTAATLLIVGGADHGVIELNQEAYERLQCEKRIEIVPEAKHLFEEPGAMDHVADLARRWFVKHVRAPAEVRPAGARGEP